MVLKEPPEPRGLESHIEPRRGVGRISVEHGYAAVHISQLPDCGRDDDRLSILGRIAQEFVSVRFPKFTPSGVSFLLPEGDVPRIERSLESTGIHYSIRDGRSVVSIHAPSIREEAGLIARLIARLMESGVPIEHIADAHDRLMAVVETSRVEGLAADLERLVEARRSSIEPRRRTESRVKILKFGGTSVETSQARAIAVQKVAEARRAGYLPVVVVSAIGRNGVPYATDTLIEQLRLACPGREPDPRDLDLMLACGEILSAVIFAQTLNSADIPAHAYRGDQAGILTDCAFGQARVVDVRPDRIEESLRDGFVPVVCGFQGCVGPGEGRAHGEVTTLGRGGSDTTASALGAALGAEAIEIYTDVDGILEADPRVVPSARPLWTVDFDEVASLAHLGAKVIHPRAVEIAKAHGIPLWIKNTFSEERGTEVVPMERRTGPQRTGVTAIDGLIYLRFDLRGIDQASRTAADQRIFNFFAEHDVSLMMVDLSPTSAGLAVPKSAYARLQPLLASLGAPISIGEACTLVSLVGHEYIRTPGTLQRCLIALRRADVATIQTNAVDPSLSILVPAADGRTAVSILSAYHQLMEDD